MTQEGRRVAWFIAVGTGAAAVHFCTAVAAVRVLGLAPPLANVVGWFVAFSFSFLGHWRTTFAGAGAPLGRSALRFLVVSALAFSANQAAYLLLLRFSPLRYDVALALVLAGVAAMTYLFSRRWAFAPR
ncbi:MAG: GtrA family protein [Burkholderiales bacterium]|nr:GtrA family protein [Burkholderiales bacterium]